MRYFIFHTAVSLIVEQIYLHAAWREKLEVRKYQIEIPSFIANYSSANHFFPPSTQTDVILTHVLSISLYFFSFSLSLSFSYCRILYLYHLFYIYCRIAQHCNLYNMDIEMCVYRLSNNNICCYFFFFIPFRLQLDIMKQRKRKVRRQYVSIVCLCILRQ